MRSEAGLVLTLLEGRDSDFPARVEVKLPGKRWREKPPLGCEGCSFFLGNFRRGLSAALGQEGNPWREVFCSSHSSCPPEQRDFCPFSVLLGSVTLQPRRAGSREALRDPGGGSSCAPPALQKLQEAERRIVRAQRVLNAGRDQSSGLSIQWKAGKPVDDP